MNLASAIHKLKLFAVKERLFIILVCICQLIW